MVSAQYLSNAVLCVKSLQKGNVTDEKLFQNPQNASLAATLSAMSHSASFVQDTVNRNPELKDIEIVVACKINKISFGSSRSEQKSFFLWNTINSSPFNNRNVSFPMTGDPDRTLPDVTLSVRTQPNEQSEQRRSVKPPEMR